MVKYKTTFKECLKRIEGGNVCEGCGGKLEPIETVDNSDWPTFWVGCKHCMCFRGGIKKEYWEIARQLVKEDMLIPYPHMQKHEYEDTPERLGYYLDSQTAGLSWEIGYIHRLLKEEIKAKLLEELRLDIYLTMSFGSNNHYEQGRQDTTRNHLVLLGYDKSKLMTVKDVDVLIRGVS